MSHQSVLYGFTCHACSHTECSGYLQLYDVHEGDPQYILPAEEYTYMCVPTCASPNVIREGHYCDGNYTQAYLTALCIKWSTV